MHVIGLTGFWPHATDEVTHRLLAGDPGLCRASLSPRAGSDAMAMLASGRHGGDRLLVTLPEVSEPDQLRAAWPAQPDSATLHICTVVPADLALDGLLDETDLLTVGLADSADDDRSIGQLVARQLEQADTVLLTGPFDSDDWDADQLRVLLRRIAPWSEHPQRTQPRLLTAGRRDPVSPLIRGLSGYPVGVHDPLPDHGVTATVFRTARPFHPQRLHDALDDITGHVLRSRGHFWLATRPDLVMTWESSGGLSVGPIGGWLADVPDWSTVDTNRRLAADIDWDPYYGDRHQHLAFVGIDLDAANLQRTLHRCLLTDNELAEGEEAWRSLPDPFARAYPDTVLALRDRWAR